MMDIPYEEALAKIKEASGLSDEEIATKIEQKLQELNGLISKDGAAHILANELGVQLVDVSAPKEREVKVAEVKLQDRGITVKGKVIRKYDVREFNKNGREGRVASLLMGDDSGVTRLVFWNDQVDVFQELKEQDVLVVQNPHPKESYQKDRIELQLNQQSTLTVNPEGVVVESGYKPQEAKQMYIKDLQGGEQAELIATVVQVYDPRFYDACPQCRKKVDADGKCPVHGVVEPEVNFSINAFLDDGTGNIRTNFWKQQSLELTNKSAEDFVGYREDTASFEAIKTALLGEIIKVVGNCRKNDNFDRLEFTANKVHTEVDPAVEINNLEKKFENAKEETPEVAEQPAKQEEPKVVEEVISLDQLEEMGK